MRTPASARTCAESQICTAFVLIGTKPTLVQNGGYARGREVLGKSRCVRPAHRGA
jgi:hypothetical protein